MTRWHFDLDEILMCFMVGCGVWMLAIITTIVILMSVGVLAMCLCCCY